MSCLLAWGSTEQGQFESDERQAEQKTPVLIKHFLREDIKLSRIACGSKHTLVLTEQGQVFSFGNNRHGALGRNADPFVPTLVNLPSRVDLISCGENHSICATASSGDCYAWGSFGMQG